MRWSRIAVYAAGVVDGEGSIGIHRYPKGRNYYPFVSVEMSERAAEVIKTLANEYGGHINRRERAKQNAVTLVWRVRSAQDLGRFLEAIEPHLILKKEQAQLALKLLTAIAKMTAGRPSNRSWTPELRERADRMWRYMKRLNARGPVSSSPEPGWFAMLVAGTWATPQRDLFTDLGWEEYCETWPSAGIVRNGVAYRLPEWEPRIYENGCSLLPTPTATDATPIMGGDLFLTKTGSVRARMKNGRTSNRGLATTVLWPTPQAHDAQKGYAGRVGRYGTEHGGRNLNDEVQMFPTPDAHCWKSGERGTGTGGGPQLSNHSVGRPGGQLNPTWVEWLMGFPLGWTDLEPLATPSSPRSQSGSEGA